MSDVKRFGWHGPTRIEADEQGEFVTYADYAALREQCRWAMEQYIEARRVDAIYRWPNHSVEWHEKVLEKDTDYQRAQAWLAANREEKA